MVRDIPVAARGILSYFARHRTLANLLFFLLVIIGLAAVPNMRTQFFHDIVYQNINVTITWEGASAEELLDRACAHTAFEHLHLVKGAVLAALGLVALAASFLIDIAGLAREARQTR